MLTHSVYMGVPLFVLAAVAWLASREWQRLLQREREQAQQLKQQSQSLEEQVEKRTQQLHSQAEALHASEARYRALVRHFPDGAVLLFDPELRYQIADGSALAVYGLSRPDIEGRTLWEVFPPALCRAIAPDYQRVLAGESLSREDVYSGGIFLSQLLPIRNEQGNVTAGLAVIQDITERKQRETALRQSEERYRVVVENQTELVCRYLPDTTITFVNEAYCRYFGKTREELIGLEIPRLLPPETREAALSHFRSLFEQPRVASFEQRSEINGETVWQLWVDQPIVDDQGKVVEILTVGRDITQRRQMEQALQEAKQMAEAASRAKSAFLANMSHEIRTPMNAVIGMTSLLLSTPLTPEQRDFVETIRISGDALLTIINDILDFSKIEAGKLALEVAPFDLATCLEETLDLFALSAASKGIELAYQINEQAPRILLGDVSRLRQILTNLVGNAVKFTECGEVVVGVDARASDAGYCVHFTVRDTGIGIAPDVIQRLFHSFSQADVSTTRKYGGTGLGLAISQRLSRLMGGELWVESKVGVGSTFHFTISAQAAVTQHHIRPAEQTSLVGKRVLIVDDNATNRRILLHQTQGWQMKPVAVGSAALALDRLATGERFDLALLDVQMPEMDGFALAAAIRRAHALPLVLLTSIGNDCAVQATALDIAACLTKPIKEGELYQTLCRVCAPNNAVPAPMPSVAVLHEALAQQLPLSILLAEDNAVNQKVATLLLERLGYRIDVVANGLEVLDALNRRTYDVILMDVQMPELDGLEATRRIRTQLPEGKQPHIIAMTAHALDDAHQECLTAGMDDYISKPVRVEQLVAALLSLQPQAEEDSS